jgi:nitrogen fixation/metabolism regulation signal transduction histidine kinase
VRLGFMFLLVNFAFATLIVGVFGYYVLDIYDAIVTYFRLSGDESAATMRKFGVPIAIGGALIVLFIVTTILVSVRYTHEIYRPLVSIHRYLDDILNGRTPSPIQLRESDQLKDLANKLNSIAERVATDQRAGPMINVHRFLDEILDGKTPKPIKLRDNDNFFELAEKLNKVAATRLKS